MKQAHEFTSKFFLLWREGYSWATLRKDLIAGITVGVIALPLAMAFSIASGTTPERGIFTAIIAGFLISALGGSRVQIGGPTGAFVVLIYDIMQRTGYEGLAVSTLIASVILIIFGFLRLGSWIKFVSHPLITGFTAGIALNIFSSQIKDFFGLQISSLPPDFLNKWLLYFQTFSTFDPITLSLGVASFIFILFFRKFSPKLPAGICAIILVSLIAYFFHLPIDTIQSKFGSIPAMLPIPSFPSFLILHGNFNEIFKDAITIALLGGIESLLSAVIADGMTGQKHKPNCELIGQGIANFSSILFGGIPATGAIARTAANIKNGAQTPIAGMIHAATLFFIVLFLGPIVGQIPLASLGAVLIMVAWNMSEVNHFIRLFKAPLEDIIVLCTTFFLTVFVDITVAILFGMTLSSFLFMKKMSEHAKAVPSVELKKQIEGVEVYEMKGPFFFGSVDSLKNILENFMTPPKVFILRLGQVSIIDASGMCALKEFSQKCHREKMTLLLSGVDPKRALKLKKFGLTDHISEQNIFEHIDAALLRAEGLIFCPVSPKERGFL